MIDNQQPPQPSVAEVRPAPKLSSGFTNAIGLVINGANPLSSVNGGTGVNNGGNTITVAGNFATSGAFPVTFTATGATGVTLPTSGTLITSAVTSLGSLTSAPVLATVGTITSGIWNGSVIGSTYGGTGINNGGNTITVAGNFATSGAFPVTFTATAATGVTLPTSGTLITSAVTSLGSLTSAPVLATVGTITSGTWNGSVIGSTYGGTGINNGGNTITVAGNFSTSGAFPMTLTSTAATSVTLPTSGTLITSAVTSLGSLTSAPVLATVGTITSGVWNGSILSSTYGGTGINNNGNTITVAGNFATSGAFPVTLTSTGATSVTLPTSGTLATVGGNGVAITNVTAASQAMADASAINIYVANFATAGTATTLTLPTTAQSMTVGHIFKVIGSGPGGWILAQNAGQTINLQANGTTTATTTGTVGNIASTYFSDCVDIVVTGVSATTTTFTVAGMFGNAPSYT